jgi:polyhydroxyalkanoate synthesis regulator phasin
MIKFGRLKMTNEHVQELKNIDLWVHLGAIDYDKAKRMARPHLEALNEQAKKIAKKLGCQSKKFYFHHFVR